ncbi:uncharacterized protein LOC131198731 [Ahaetulla prasina]|uniref:uncharacterized protein LOC131198731 n=1 Tax=Ahaetulla prasina TaxID=499056 RepID=UPI0026491DFA|nr:uncharacterized protein LOC131198731 [Ahaetulla prasina]
MVENCKKDAAISGEELAELLSVCPVQYHPGPQAGQQIAEWEGLPYQILCELKRTVTDYGVSGNFTKGLLEGIKFSLRKLANGENKACLSRNPTFSPSSSLSCAALATASSAGVDLVTQEDLDFKFPLEVKLVPSQFSGPIPSGLVGLILPRSSAHKLGCFVVPGVIDSDYTGVILMQIWVNIPQLLSKGSSVAQLLFLPYKVPISGTGHRGDAGFGSTSLSVGLLYSINSSRQLLTLYLNKQPFQGLLDTGADVTVISLLQWPCNGPNVLLIPCGALVGQHLPGKVFILLPSQLLQDPVSRPLVSYRQPPDPAWRGPAKLITWGRGYAAIEDPQTKQAVWIPSRCVRPYHGVASESSQPHSKLQSESQNGGSSSQVAISSCHDLGSS